MKKLLGATALMLSIAAMLTAQESTRIYTRPTPPPREALDRLLLKTGWQASIPMDGTRDGIATFQQAGKHVLVQTYSGLVTALDRDTGQALWRTRVGKPYETTYPLGWNHKAVFVAHGTWLYALDQSNGLEQWKYYLPDAVSTGPVADDDQVYLSVGPNQFSVYQLPEISRRQVVLTGIDANKNYLKQNVTPVERPPDFYKGSSGTGRGVGALSSAIQASRSEVVGDRPTLLQSYHAGVGVEQQPLLTPIDMVWTGASGVVMIYPKRTEFSSKSYRFPTDAPISTQPGQYGDVVFIASHDGNLYALHLPSSRVLWRYPGGNPIKQSPAVNNDDVYVAPERTGLIRLDRNSGQVIWKNPTAMRFLAANPKFVYAVDRQGRLLVLDRTRGTTLSSYEGTRDFVVPIRNEDTDRFFLAAHDGRIVCLHDQDYTTPLAMKKSEEELFPPPPKPGVKPLPPPIRPADKGMEKPPAKMMEKP